MIRRFITTLAAVTILMSVPTLPMARAGTATTQPAHPGDGRLEKFKQALKQLDLSDDQKEKIQTAMSDMKTKLEALRSAAQAGTADKTQARGIIKNSMEKILAVLTPQQRMKLREIMKNNKMQSTTQT